MLASEFGEVLVVRSDLTTLTKSEAAYARGVRKRAVASFILVLYWRICRREISG